MSGHDHRHGWPARISTREVVRDLDVCDDRAVLPMTLRTRLVLALVLLSTLGLSLFGFTTYKLYERSQLQQLDDQLQNITGPQSGRLQRAINESTSGATGCTSAPATTDPGSGSRTHGGGFGAGQGLDAFVELMTSDGTQVACIQALSTSGRPKLPADLGALTVSHFYTTGSSGSGGRWRVLATPVTGQTAGSVTPTNMVIAIAVPTGGLDESMRRLVRIEMAAAAILLAALAAGAWLILRRGLRPLEKMADSASTITAGDLSVRVSPAESHTEVGQMGLAFNSMLDGIEGSFREREATERRLRQFLADASHELRTPLTSIRGFAELFRLGPDQNRVDLPVIMRRIEQESSRMKILVDDLLLLAELDETRPAASRPVDLTVLAADACTDAVAMAPDRRVTLEAPAPVHVLGDADHLRQAIANLVTNAIRHTPPGTPIEVATAQSGDRALVRVRDHGAGLDPAAVPHVFDRFWQADSARVGTGAGLGLAIVAGIADEHQGRAWVENVADGGAAFMIEIPIRLPG